MYIKENTRFYEIFVHDPDSKKEYKIADTIPSIDKFKFYQSGEPVFSPNGKKVAFVAGGSLYTIDLDNESPAPKLIYHNSDLNFRIFDLSLNSEGNKILFVGKNSGQNDDEQIYSIGNTYSVTDKLHQITHFDDVSNLNLRKRKPIFTPDEKNIVALTKEKTDNSEYFNMSLLKADTGKITDKIQIKTLNFTDGFSISPDGSKIAFVQYYVKQNYLSEIYLADLHENKFENSRVVYGKYKFIQSLSWSTDGKSLVFRESLHNTLKKITFGNDWKIIGDDNSIADVKIKTSPLQTGAEKKLNQLL